MQLQGDEKTLDKLLGHLRKDFPRLSFALKTPLRELFPKPEKKYLMSIWGGGHADIVVLRHRKLVAIIEPGGNNHFKEDKQKDRDKRKDWLCRENGVNCLRVSNGFISYLDKPITRKLLKKYFYGERRK